MSGLLISVIPKTFFDFGSIALPPNATPLIPLSEAIDVLDYVDAMMVVRVHNLAIAGVSNKISLGLYSDGFLDAQTGAMATLPFAAIDFNSFSVPSTVVVSGGRALGTYVALGISATRQNSGSMTATLSIDVLLRGPDPVPSELADMVMANRPRAT